MHLLGISTIVNNAVTAFKATSIVSFNPEAIPDEAFLLETTDEQVSANNYNNDAQRAQTKQMLKTTFN